MNPTIEEQIDALEYSYRFTQDIGKVVTAERINAAIATLRAHESQAKLLEEANKLLYNTMSVLNERGCEHTATTIYKFLSRVEKH